MISEEEILNNGIKWKFDEINFEQESYWKQSEADYGIEEYSFEDVSELKSKITEKTEVCPETAKCLAIEAYMRYYGSSCRDKEQKDRASALPDFVYML